MEPSNLSGCGKGGYYDDRLSAERLKRCYDIAPPAVIRYLEAEIAHVCSFIHPADAVLELGCGYGRILPDLASRADEVVGIDTSLESLKMARVNLRACPRCSFANMDATRLGFPDGAFDLVVCIQNGISAFHVDQRALIGESIRVTAPGGKALFSSYSDAFWEERLEWFRLQAEAGLIGELDQEKTGNGVIVCKDGFTATTVGPEQFMTLVENMNVDAQCREIDGSSVFLEIVPR
jgi:SAM-dependent methyltransferase